MTSAVTSGYEASHETENGRQFENAAEKNG
jgi:hypothetical protein